MNKLLKSICAATLYVWQFPQNLTGLGLLCCLGVQSVSEYDGRRFYIAPGMRGGISLGRYIILSPQAGLDKRVYCHEYGHSRQSAHLGPLYLLVVGLPSLLHAALHRTGDYYRFWTERWADHLGGIVYRNGVRTITDLTHGVQDQERRIW